MIFSTVCFMFRPFNDKSEEANCNLFFCDTTDENMTQNQKDIVNIYSLFAVLMFAGAVCWGILYKFCYLGWQQFCHGM